MGKHGTASLWLICKPLQAAFEILMSKYSKVIAGIGLPVRLCLLLAAGCSLTSCSKNSAESGPGVSVQVVKAKRGPISRVVSADAVLFPLDQAALTPKITAPVRQFYVQRGARVRKGQLLAVLENRDLAAAATESKGNYEQAEAGYKTRTAASLPEEIQKAELDAQVGKENFEAQKKLYESRQQLFKEGALPRKDLDQASVTFQQARQQYEIAQRHLTSLQQVGKEQELKSATGQLTAAQGRFKGAMAQLSYSEIRSPINGVVTERPLYRGEVAPAGTPLITVMDLSQVVARAHIPQDEAVFLKKGDEGTMAVPGLDTPVEGKVILVNPALDPNSTTVEVWLQAANPKELLKPGTSVRISVTAQTVPDAIVIPGSAVLTSPEGTTSVMVVGGDNIARNRDVKIGIKEGDVLQALAGVQPGDRVIKAGAYGLPDKTKVTIEEPAEETESPDPAKDAGSKEPALETTAPQGESNSKSKVKRDVAKVGGKK